eukprot:TRINITY_DN1182_c0_g1_i1.p1 TRINITY_DN1182_c0_g1~~TRINITY_DN1182_c0_g1_i1.p1  ORF type:complete len:378 (-),score=117.38 TRINITY_DN1182_c0_g1_i1:2706-3839(-)
MSDAKGPERFLVRSGSQDLQTLIDAALVHHVEITGMQKIAQVKTATPSSSSTSSYIGFLTSFIPSSLYKTPTSSSSAVVSEVVMVNQFSIRVFMTKKSKPDDVKLEEEEDELIEFDTFVILKRYSQFLNLYSALKKFFHDEIAELLAVFPPKKTIFVKLQELVQIESSSDAAFMEKRRVLLENFLNLVIQNSSMRKSQLFEEFIRSDAVYNIISDKEDGEKLEPLETSFSGSEVDAAEEAAAELDEEMIIDDDRLVHEIVVDKVTSLENHHSMVLYQINCQGQDHSWKVFRRFKQISELDAGLRKLLNVGPLSPMNTIHLPTLPSKKIKWFSDHKDPQFLEKRRILVQNYLRRINAIPEAYKSDIFLTFLGVPGFCE